MSAADPITAKVYRTLADCWPLRMSAEHLAAELGVPVRSASRAVQRNVAQGMAVRCMQASQRGFVYQART